jgi:monomeric sarcosine oxidase
VGFQIATGACVLLKEVQSFDIAVLGLGTMGSFTCLELARRGARVIGIDQFDPPHTQGSHSGDTRVFRTAYAEHPDYVPLAIRAGDLWDRLGADFGKPLLTRSGMLTLGPPSGELISGIRKSASLHNLKVEALSGDEIRRRYPAFSPPDDYVGEFESAAGWVDVNASITEAIKAARQSGAEILTNMAVKGWCEHLGRIVVETAAGPIEATKLVVAAGAWTASILRDLNLPLTIRRKVLVWIDPAHPELFAPNSFPVFAIADRFFYGFPNISGDGVKLAIHWEDAPKLQNVNQPVAPADDSDIAPVLDLVARYLPALVQSPSDARLRVKRTATCLYTMTPDEHFIVDRHPTLENVFIAAGFSGHGFKFAPAIAELLADFCTTGLVKTPELLSIKRFIS